VITSERELMRLAVKTSAANASGMDLKTSLRGWIPALDGIRGLAMLLVLLYHFKGGLDSSSLPQHLLKWFAEFGKTGVDLFFVLSGFLITGILLESRDADNRFVAYYMRRILRIFPIYYLSLFVVFLVVPLLFPDSPVRLRPTYERVLFLTYLQNWQGNVQPEWPHLLVHYWSLAVEEQFYLVWPVLIFLLSPRKILQIIAGACVFSLALRIAFMVFHAPADIYYRNTLARMDTLLIGAACAFLLRNDAVVHRLRRYAAWLWLLPVVLLFIWRAPLPMTPARVTLEKTIGFTAIALCYAGLLVSVVLTMGSKSMLQRFFASRMMRLFGRYSYGTYIWHLLVAQLVLKAETSVLHVKVPTIVNIPILIAAAIALGMCSYILVERPFLALKRHFEQGASGSEKTSLSRDAIACGER
jgi:peptidoglycan/LPS O-acetylase OafA/YrhL